MKNVLIINNPIIQNALGHLRNKDTKMDEFRYYSDRLCKLLLSYAFEESDVKTVDIETEFVKTTMKKLKDNFVIISILRSAIAMLPSIIDLVPNARIGFAGIVRDEQTARPCEYYWKMPLIRHDDSVLIVDPMLATGGSCLHVLKRLDFKKPRDVRIISIVTAPEGIKEIHHEYPNVQIITAAVDKYLNSRKYIIPGLGDFGDRYFGTIESEDSLSKEVQKKISSRQWYE